VLIAYGARRGSARRACEVVADTLAARGFDVDLRPSAGVESLDRYGAVVLGGSVRLGHWHRDSRHFLHRHRRALARLPVAVFATGSAHAGDRAESLEEALAEAPELEPVATARFAGVAAGTRLGVLGHDGSAGSDVEPIRAWAEDLARELGP
jgi:menaquinone-dependent protoporphyrinogen IX oxidase